MSVLAASALLLWLNAYWCREVFFLEDFGQPQSMHGFWMGLARLGSFTAAPQWWRYSYNGMPFEFAYAPGLPALISAVVEVTNWSHGRAFGVVVGAIFCLGPLALYWLAADLTKRPWWSFVASFGYSLLTPSQVFAPDADRSWTHLADTRRILLTFAWDEAPHLLAFALVLLATLFLVRGMDGNRLWLWPAGIMLGSAMATSAFGGTTGAVFLGLVWLSGQPGNRMRSLLWIGGCGVAAYLAIAPFFPPSLIRVIQANARLAAPSGPALARAAALAFVVLGAGALAYATRRWSWHLRFFTLAAFVFGALVLFGRWDLQLLPQALRYKIELDAVLVLLGAFALARAVRAVPRRWYVAAVLLLAIPGVSRVKAHRRYAKKILVPAEARSRIEFRVAAWLAANAPGQRVMAPGSIGQWMPAYSAQEQFTGGSFPTTPTVIVQAAHWGIPHLSPQATPREVAKWWLQAYGVDALVVPGRNSPEYWKPFEHPEQFAALFPRLWREDDTAIYQVPRTHRSLAGVVTEDKLVRHPPGSFFQVDQLAVYAGALEELPAGLQWKWEDRNAALVRGVIARGQVVTTHVTYHPGWSAYRDGAQQPVAADGLGQLVIRPDCNGFCEVRLVYEGGPEARLTRAASGITLVGAGIGALWLIRRTRRERTSEPDRLRSRG